MNDFIAASFYLLLEVEDRLSQSLHVWIQLVRLPHQSDALSHQRLDLLLESSNQQRDGGPLLHFLTGALVGANAFNQRDCKRVELIGLVGFVDDGQRNAEAEPLEVANLLR